MIDPNDYIITRKRKKYKFALFANSPLCFEFEQWQKQVVDCIELGAGTGHFSVEHAALHPDKTFVAIDVKADRLQKGAAEAAERGLTNVRFLRARADQLLDLFNLSSIQSIWLTFPDPFPKKRSAGRRMTHGSYLALYSQLLSENGSLYLKHDSRDFFQWSLEQLVANKWHVEELSFDLHESSLPDEYKIKTVYEERWLGEGSLTNFVRASFKS
jgi:tRNA (guanine-N7-)-methyltransferase